MLLNVSQLTKSYSAKIVLQDVSFHINQGDRLAVVGSNGSGKTTLFRLICGEEEPDSGEVHLSKDVCIGLLSQFDDMDGNRSLYDEVLSQKQDVLDLMHEARIVTQAMAEQTDRQEELLAKYDRILHELEERNAYAYESEVKGALIGMGFSEESFSKKISSLSGGERTRIQLIKLLLSDPDLLMLDEPTNHLDIDSVRWLENYLKSFRKTLIVISHDRYFMDAVADKVLELKNGRARLFTGNYTEAQEKSRLIYEAQIKQYQKQQQEIAHQEKVIQKLKQFNREKSVRRAESREKLLMRMDRIEDPKERELTIETLIHPKRRSGDDVFRLEGIRKSFGDRVILENADASVYREERIAVIGPNGCGKTTLLRMILGQETPDAGTIRHGAKLDIGYYDQRQASFHEDYTIFEEIGHHFHEMTETGIRNTLAMFQFYGDDVKKRISMLSGGERARVALCILFLKKPNVLILDEPTNHLDISMRESLEGILEQYEGTVLFVSHDRYFINRICDRILSFESGRLISYPGDYDYYLEKRVMEETTNTVSGAVNAGAQAHRERKQREAERRRIRNIRKKASERSQELEIRIAELEEFTAQEEVAADFETLHRAYEEMEVLQEEYFEQLEIMEDCERIMAEEEE